MPLSARFRARTASWPAGSVWRWVGSHKEWLLWAVLREMEVTSQGPLYELSLHTTAVALGVVAGFLSQIPGGLVMREWVSGELMGPQYGVAVGMISAVIFRLVLLVSELSVSIILYAAGRRAPTRSHGCDLLGRIDHLGQGLIATRPGRRRLSAVSRVFRCLRSPPYAHACSPSSSQYATSARASRCYTASLATWPGQRLRAGHHLGRRRLDRRLVAGDLAAGRRRSARARAFASAATSARRPPCRAGFAGRAGELVITLDADLQDDPREIPALPGRDGRRTATSSAAGSRCATIPGTRSCRRGSSTGWSSRLTGVQLHDHNCGMKCYRREVFDEVRLYGELHRFVPVLAAARGFRSAKSRSTTGRASSAARSTACAASSRVSSIC